MQVGDALQGVKRLFLDTAPVIYYVERNRHYLPVVRPVFESLDAGTLQSVTSPVTLSECLILPQRLQNEKLLELFTGLIVRRSVFVTLDQNIALSAARLRSTYNMNLLDAFQIAAALSSNCEAFQTNDAELKRVTDLRILIVDELDAEATRAGGT